MYIEAKINHMSERSTAELSKIFCLIEREVEAKIKHVAERSEPNVSIFFYLILTGDAKINHACNRRYKTSDHMGEGLNWTVVVNLWGIKNLP